VGNLSSKKAERFSSEKELVIRGAGPAGKKSMDTSNLKISWPESSRTLAPRLKGEH
jgi:hypothetical protein